MQTPSPLTRTFTYAAPEAMAKAASILESYASAFSQEHRILGMSLDSGCDLGPLDLIPHRLTGWEAINEGFRYELEALSSDVNIELKRVLGVPIEVTILLSNGQERIIAGLVTGVNQEGSDGGFATYRLVIESGIQVIRHRVTSRVFTEIDARALTAKIIGEHLQGNAVLQSSFELVDRCQKTYPVHPFYMQYGVSDFDFLRRIWSREGISFVILPSDKSSPEHPQHVLMLFDDPLVLDVNGSSPARFHRSDGTEKQDAITEWKAHRVLQSGSVSRSTWEQSQASIRGVDAVVSSDQGGSGVALAETLNDYTTEPHLEVRDAADFDAAIELRRNRKEQLTKTFEGEGAMRAFVAGTWFELRQHPVHDQDDRINREFVVTRLELEVVNNLPKEIPEEVLSLLKRSASGKPVVPYRNRFHCVRRGIPIVPAEVIPPAPGLLTARVVGPEGEAVHTDPLGRIKIRFPFTRLHEHPETGASDRDGDSAWVRQSESWSSEAYGSNFVPRPGNEVVVQFLGGDPDKPVVIGSVYNGVNTPTSFSDASALPLDKAMSGMRSRMHHGSGGNELVLDDTTNELRARLATNHAQTELNLGFIVHPRTGGKAVPRGEGFELRTDAWGTLRAERGLLISTDARQGAAGDHADPKELVDQTKSQLELSKNLSKYSKQHEAFEFKAIQPVTKMKEHLEGVKEHPNGETTKKVAASTEAVLGISSPSTIVEGTPETIVKTAGKQFLMTSGQDTNIAVGRRLVMAIYEAWSTVAKSIKLFAGKGDIAIQAHEGDIHLAAEKDMKLIACNQGADFASPTELTLAAGGCKITLKGGQMEWIAPTAVNVRSKFRMVSAMPKVYPMPMLVKEEEIFDRGFFVHDDAGNPVSNVRYEIKTAEGKMLRGYTDAQGHTSKVTTKQPERIEIKIFERTDPKN